MEVIYNSAYNQLPVSNKFPVWISKVEAVLHLETYTVILNVDYTPCNPVATKAMNKLSQIRSVISYTIKHVK